MAVDESTSLCNAEGEAHRSWSHPKTSYQTISERNVNPSDESISDEERAHNPQDASQEASVQLSTSFTTVVYVLLLGEFISNADGTLVTAALGKISSEFNRLQNADWLSTSYTLGLCSAQLMYGRLSDIYGRKPLLLIAYAFFGIGCLISGIANNLWIVIAGRAISGIGGAGIMTIGSVIITEIVPKRDLASWRSYINVSMTLGRSMGGPVGGWLTDAIGWRWLFLIQIPFIFVGFLLVVAKVNLTRQTTETSARHIDFLGSVFLSSSVVSMMTFLSQGGRAIPWLSLKSLFMGGTGAILFMMFILTELYIAPEPIFDLRILRRPNVAVSYIIAFVQITSQVAIMFTIPLYFQVTQHTSATMAGIHLVPAVAGNTIGSLLAGLYISVKGEYKTPLVASGVVAAITHLVLIFRWNGTPTGFWESQYVIPSGIGTGAASGAAFVSMTDLLQPQEIAMAIGGFMLLLSIAMTTGVTITNATLGTVFKHQLQRTLKVPGAQEIIRRATIDIDYIASLTGNVREIVVNSYVTGLKSTYLTSLIFTILTSLVALTVRRSRLHSGSAT